MTILLQALSTFVSLAVLLLAINRREMKKSLYLTYFLFAVFQFNLGYLVEISATVREVAIIGKQLKYLGVPFIAPLLFLLVLDYYDIKKLSNSMITALMTVPVMHSVFAITFPWNGLYYTSITWIAEAAIPYLKVEISPYHDICYLYYCVIKISAIVLALFYGLKSADATKKWSAALIAFCAVPWAWYTINWFSPFDSFFGPRSVLLSTMLILLGYFFILLSYSFLWLRLSLVVPYAREHIVENMKDAFVLIDRRGCYIEANSTAKKLFPSLAETREGAPMEQIKEIPWSSEQANIENWTFCLPDERGVERHYRISKTVISHKNEINCDCIMIYDITESKKMLDEVTELAERDALTGLINRRTFFSKCEWLFQEIALAGVNMSVLMMDLDHFKKLNDTYGHQIGDEVLKIVAQNLSKRFRSTDLFTRYGGEEFCAFLPRTNEKSAMHIAQKLCDITENIDFGSKLPGLKITISIGVAIYNAAAHRTLDALIGSADTALYTAKNTGRNRVCVYGS